MVKALIVRLKSKQIAFLLHDYVADKCKKLCFDNSIINTSTRIYFEKESPKMLCVFSNKDLIIKDKEKLLYKLPHTGLHSCVLSNKQIKNLLQSDINLTIDELDFSLKSLNKRTRKSVRVMTLNEKDMKCILFKQLFDYYAEGFDFSGNNIHIGMNLLFDETKTKAIWYCSNDNLAFDINKLDNLKYSISENEEYEYVKLTEKEIETMKLTEPQI